jgi:hypothetical protein
LSVQKVVTRLMQGASATLHDRFWFLKRANRAKARDAKSTV